MRSKHEYYFICAEIFKDLRAQAGLSKAKMAQRMQVDERTYSRYEDGESMPTLPAFLNLLDQIDAPVVNTVMRHLYPESFEAGAATTQVRRALVEYIQNTASDRAVREMAYLIHGPHGSPLEAQLQLFTAIDHLPMDSRLLIAKMALNMWEIENARDGLINPEDAQPDMELLRAAIIKAHMAVIDGRQNYSTATK